MTILPGVSAFALAAARLTWPLEQVSSFSLHGRPLEHLALHVHPGAKLLILAQDRNTPGAVSRWLLARGFGDSRIVALAHMGGAREAWIEGRASDWNGTVPDFHTLAVECVASPGAIWHAATGLPDDAFDHDGKLTKREVRALALAKLMPHPGARLVDVGAGCGSIGIEWMRAARGASAVAIEPRPDRRAMAARNAATLGVPDLDIRDGTAPEALAALSLVMRCSSAAAFRRRQ
jgi:precorrin-6Y C5,15-methyltransferase (decarboxylating)